MKSIITIFKSHILQKDKRCSHANGQTKNVNGREGLVIPEDSPGDDEVVSDHC